MDTDHRTTASWEHYRREREPRSTGRVLLSQALVTHTLLNWGMSGTDIANAFAPGGNQADRDAVETAIALFEAPLLEGRFLTWGRPFGGGPPVLLEPSHWEIDDFAPRFATSALNLACPFDPRAEPTHWIFVEELVIDALHDLHSEDPAMRRVRTVRSEAKLRQQAAVSDPVPPTVHDEGGLLSRPDVERLVGLKKSTIYQRIKEGRFPAPVRNGERLSSWRESDIRNWIRDPR